jgi:hypothetical protein
MPAWALAVLAYLVLSGAPSNTSSGTGSSNQSGTGGNTVNPNQGSNDFGNIVDSTAKLVKGLADLYNKIFPQAPAAPLR